jgi:transketolase
MTAATLTGGRDTARTLPERIAHVGEAAYRMRHHILTMAEGQGQGYVGQALGAADTLAAVYTDQLRLRPEDPEWPDRDRFLLSTGHYAIGLYSALAEVGTIPVGELATYGTDESRLPMSPSASPSACATRETKHASSTSSPTANSTRAPRGRRPWAPTTTS